MGNFELQGNVMERFRSIILLSMLTMRECFVLETEIIKVFEEGNSVSTPVSSSKARCNFEMGGGISWLAIFLWLSRRGMKKLNHLFFRLGVLQNKIQGINKSSTKRCSPSRFLNYVVVQC